MLSSMVFISSAETTSFYCGHDLFCVNQFSLPLPFLCLTTGKHLTVPLILSEQKAQNIHLPAHTECFHVPDICFTGLIHAVGPPELSQSIPSPGDGGLPLPQK